MVYINIVKKSLGAMDIFNASIYCLSILAWQTLRQYIDYSNYSEDMDFTVHLWCED